MSRGNGTRAGGAPQLRVATLPQTSTRNPYLGLLHRELRNHGIEHVGDGRLSSSWLIDARSQVDVLHFHWRLDRLIDPAAAGDLERAARDLPKSQTSLALRRIRRALVMARRLGYVIAWTVHDPARLLPASSNPERAVGMVLAEFSDVVFVHQAASKREVEEWLAPRHPAVVIGHGNYCGIYPATTPRIDVRTDLGVDDSTFVFLAFGHLRVDKQLPLLLEAFRRVRRDDVALVVAGSPSHASSAEAAQEAAASDPRIRLRLSYVEPDAVGSLHAAADTVVLARSRDWTSASLILALSLGKPVVAADLPTTREVVGPGGWWFTPGDRESLSAALDRAAETGEIAIAVGEAGRRHVEGFSWEAAASETAAALLRSAGHLSAAPNGQR